MLMVSAHGYLPPRHRQDSERVRRIYIQIMAARKQKERAGAGSETTSFQVQPPVIHLQVGPTSIQQVSYCTPMNQLPPPNSSFEHLRPVWDILHLSHENKLEK